MCNFTTNAKQSQKNFDNISVTTSGNDNFFYISIKKMLNYYIAFIHKCQCFSRFFLEFFGNYVLVVENR